MDLQAQPFQPPSSQVIPDIMRQRRTLLTMPFPNYWYTVSLSIIKRLLINATKGWMVCYAVINNWNNLKVPTSHGPYSLVGAMTFRNFQVITVSSNTMFVFIISSQHRKAISLAFELGVLLWTIGPWNMLLTAFSFVLSSSQHSILKSKLHPH